MKVFEFFWKSKEIVKPTNIFKSNINGNIKGHSTKVMCANAYSKSNKKIVSPSTKALNSTYTLFKILYKNKIKILLN